MIPSTEGRGPRILIVDDQGANVRLLMQTLRRAGYLEVASTLEPREVADLHRRDRYHLILLDLQMPHMDGFEVMAALREIRQAHPVVILVISAEPRQMHAALEAGADSFLAKPFRLPDVVGRVELMLSQSFLPNHRDNPAGGGAAGSS